MNDINLDRGMSSAHIIMCCCFSCSRDIVRISEIHNYNIRSSQGLDICGPRTYFGQKNVLSLKNRLLSSLKFFSSFVVFKKS